MLDYLDARGCPYPFQSAPDREVGRCMPTAPTSSGPQRFQSAPDREVGRCPTINPALSAHNGFQSAPDREVGRCTDQLIEAVVDKSFNPRPTVRSGDAHF